MAKNSFNSISLSDNILSVNGTGYPLDAVSTPTVSVNNSSFVGIGCTDNGNGTCTLVVNGQEITVNGEEYSPSAVYSGNIQPIVSTVTHPSQVSRGIAIKFATPPLDEDDWDACMATDPRQYSGIYSFTNQTIAYLWAVGDSYADPSYSYNDSLDIRITNGWDNPCTILLTGDYDIFLNVKAMRSVG